MHRESGETHGLREVSPCSPRGQGSETQEHALRGPRDPKGSEKATPCCHRGQESQKDALAKPEWAVMDFEDLDGPLDSASRWRKRLGRPLAVSSEAPGPERGPGQPP